MMERIQLMMKVGYVLALHLFDGTFLVTGGSLAEYRLAGSVCYMIQPYPNNPGQMSSMR
jgi:hypothetical protein